MLVSLIISNRDKSKAHPRFWKNVHYPFLSNITEHPSFFSSQNQLVPKSNFKRKIWFNFFNFTEEMMMQNHLLGPSALQGPLADTLGLFIHALRFWGNQIGQILSSLDQHKKTFFRRLIYILFSLLSTWEKQFHKPVCVAGTLSQKKSREQFT